MTGARYQCCDERRRAAWVAPGAPAGISGIDYIEVRQGATVAQPSHIDIVLVKPLALPAAALTGTNITLTGGVRFAPPVIDPLVQAQPGGTEVAVYRVTLPGGQPTDFSTYRLAIVAGPGSDDPPAFLDPRLAAVDFSFKVDCASDADCAEQSSPLPPAATGEPELDYRAREWEGFRRLMLDRMAVLVPGFREDDPIDLTTTIIEAVAFRADQQSYQLDWVGTEAFLDTARSRTSVTRHARLVDYAPGEGAGARTFVALTYEPDAAHPDGFEVPASTPILPRTGSLPVVVPASAYEVSVAGAPIVFETMAPVTVWAWQGAIAVHTWTDERCVLAAGATSVTLVDGSAGGPGALRTGDLLVLVETAAPDTGRAADADPFHRHVVRLTAVTAVRDVLVGLDVLDVSWDASDALPFDLVVSAEVSDGSGTARLVVCAEARGNVAVADQGASLPPPAHLGVPPAAAAALAPRLDPPTPPAGERWRPRLRGTGLPIARVGAAGPDDDPPRSASALVTVDPQACLPAVELQDAFATWTARRDLLASGRFGRDFVVEAGPAGEPALRFGDGIHGLAPAPGAAIAVRGRFGTGSSGNVGPDALGHIVLPEVQAQVPITSVTNVIAATGGAAPESIAAVRVAAPQAYRVQERAVTAADYATAALRFPGVANAVAVPRWTGAWQTILVHVDRAGGLPFDAAFRTDLLTHLDRFRLAGFDVSLRPAQVAPLDVALFVCAAPGTLRSDVGRRVRRALSPAGPGDGSPGFFHPDRFTFGTPLYLSAVVAAVMAVTGVQTVTPTLFQRFGRLARDELAEGVVRPVGTEILELRDDPTFPERGRLRITVGGGR